MSTETAGKSPGGPEFHPGASGAAAALGFLALVAGVIWCFLITHPQPVSTLIVAAPDQERIFSTISPYGPGLERELVEDFCKQHGYKVKWIRTETLEQGWELLASGKAQVFLSTGYKPGRIPASLPVEAGPVYETHRPVLVGPAGRPGRGAAEDLAERAALGGNIASVNRELYREAARRGNAAPRPMPKATAEVDKTLRALDSGDAPMRFALVENGSYLPWRPFHHRVRPAVSLDELVAYRWFWRTDVPKLGKRLTAFFHEVMTDGRLADLQERYYGFFPEQGPYGQLWLLRNAVRSKLPLYRHYILDAAQRYHLDPLLLVAVIFQESAFDPEAQSYTGVRGLMQLTEQTASALGASDRTDPAQSIYFGAKYLSRLWKELAPLHLATWDRWCFVLAGYNQGIGHVYDAMFLAKRLGKNPKNWREVKTVLPLLADAHWHARTIFGYSRGGEGVDYVERVRFYYYVLKGLSFLPGLELQQLAPLVPDLSAAGFRPLLDGVRLPAFPG